MWTLTYNMFLQFGLEDLAKEVTELATDPTKTDAERYVALYDTQAYKQRFPAMKYVQQQGWGWSEKDYMTHEQSYKEKLLGAGLPSGFYDSRQDYANWIEQGVSPDEIGRRVAAAQRIVNGADQSLKDTALGYYGVDSGHMLAYVLDPEKAQPIIDKQMRAIEFGAAANAAQFNIDKTNAEALSSAPQIENIDPATLRARFGDAKVLADQNKRLSSIEGTDYSSTEAIRAQVLNDTQASLASQQRAERERARFGGAAAFQAKSLGSSSL